MTSPDLVRAEDGSRAPWQWVLLGGLTVGVLDLLDAFIFFGLRGVAPIRIPQSIAAGLLGRTAFSGGAAAAVLGTLLHFFNATTIAATYYLLSRRFDALVRHPFFVGPLYGWGVWLVMNFLVIPLSATSRGTLSAAIVANGLAIHALGVGLPSALFARAARRREQRVSS